MRRDSRRDYTEFAAVQTKGAFSPQRNRWFADSLLEGTGFEPSGPPRKRRPSREAPRPTIVVSRDDLRLMTPSNLSVRHHSSATAERPFTRAGPMVRIRFPPAVGPNPLRFGGSHPNFAPSPEFGPINGARSTARRYSYSVLGGTGPGTTSTFGTDWVDTYNPSTGQVIYDGEGTAIRSAILNANGTVTQLANFSAAATEAALNHIYALRTIPSGT